MVSRGWLWAMRPSRFYPGFRNQVITRSGRPGKSKMALVWAVSFSILARVCLSFPLCLIDDTVDFQFADATNLPLDRVDVSHLPPWKDFVGVPFGWGWVTVNQQGYCDGMLLSLGGIFPQVVLSVIASSIKIGQV